MRALSDRALESRSNLVARLNLGNTFDPPACGASECFRIMSPMIWRQRDANEPVVSPEAWVKNVAEMLPKPCPKYPTSCPFLDNRILQLPVMIANIGGGGGNHIAF